VALEELHTVAEVARDLRVDRETLYRRIRAGELDVVRIGRTIRVPASSIERLTRTSSERGSGPTLGGGANDPWRPAERPEPRP